MPTAVGRGPVALADVAAPVARCENCELNRIVRSAACLSGNDTDPCSEQEWDEPDVCTIVNVDVWRSPAPVSRVYPHDTIIMIKGTGGRLDDRVVQTSRR